MIFSRFGKFVKYFGSGYEIKLIYILAMSFLSSLLEFLSIVLVFPFMMIMVNPSRVVNNPVAQYLKQNFGIEGQINMIFAIGGIIAFLIIIKNIFNIFINYQHNKMISEWGLEIKEKMVSDILYAPYEADLIRGKTNNIDEVTKIIDAVMQNYVFKTISLISNTILIIIIFSILVYLVPLFTFLAIIFFAIAGYVQNGIFQKWTERIAIKKFQLTNGAYQEIINSFSFIKDIKVNGSENYFFNFFKDISAKIIPYNEKLTLIPTLPQYITEIIFIFTMMILCVGILVQYGENPSNILISFGVVAVTIYRIVPQIYKSQMYLAAMNIFGPKMDELFSIYEEYQKYEYPKDRDTKEKMSFENSIKLENISYSYDKKTDVITDVSLEIKKGEFIGIVGLSGAGKSTLMDCLMGLLKYDGRILIDDTVLTIENLRTFRNIIGYVPQRINTIVGDIYTNVAWGIERKDIDKEKVIEVLKTAQLYDQLQQTEYGFGLELKENGTGLSGGQMQRIGIARALYKDPEIILLDEATSNLDVKIESKLTEVISNIKGQKTIIAIAHRLSTLVNCDRIVYLKDGFLVDIGTFKELSENYKEFEEIIKLSKIKFEE